MSLIIMHWASYVMSSCWTKGPIKAEPERSWRIKCCTKRSSYDHLSAHRAGILKSLILSISACKENHANDLGTMAPQKSCSTPGSEILTGSSYSQRKWSHHSFLVASTTLMSSMRTTKRQKIKQNKKSFSTRSYCYEEIQSSTCSTDITSITNKA